MCRRYRRGRAHLRGDDPGRGPSDRGDAVRNRGGMQALRGQRGTRPRQRPRAPRSRTTRASGPAGRRHPGPSRRRAGAGPPQLPNPGRPQRRRARPLATQALGDRERPGRHRRRPRTRRDRAVVQIRGRSQRQLPRYVSAESAPENRSTRRDHLRTARWRDQACAVATLESWWAGRSRIVPHRMHPIGAGLHAAVNGNRGRCGRSAGSCSLPRRPARRSCARNWREPSFAGALGGRRRRRCAPSRPAIPCALPCGP
jgi:hypothetical protein